MNGATQNQQQAQIPPAKQAKPPPAGPAPPAPATAPPVPPTNPNPGIPQPVNNGRANGPAHHHHHHHHQHNPNGQTQASSGKNKKRNDAPLDPAAMYESLKNRIAALEEEEEIEEEEERKIGVFRQCNHRSGAMRLTLTSGGSSQVGQRYGGKRDPCKIRRTGTLLSLFEAPIQGDKISSLPNSNEWRESMRRRSKNS